MGVHSSGSGGSNVIYQEIGAGETWEEAMGIAKDWLHSPAPENVT